MNIPNAPVQVGDLLAGKYRVERLLGMGAMGVVVEATHIGLEQRVALKFLLTQRGPHEQHYQRFLREARACVALRSQHVTRVTDVGTLANGAPYMVMELLDGRDLDETLERRGALPIPEAVEYILQTCEAIAEAHRAGIVHRDLKPANLFLTTSADGSPCIKVLDFGVSKFVRAELKLTTEGMAIGSPLYMSPEAWEGKMDVDTRTDQWALGVILYELVTAWTPFHADNLTALRTNVLVKPPTPLATYRQDAPPGFEAIILQCLEKDRTRRWPNVAAFAAALAPYASPRALPYAARVASVLGMTIEPSRPTDVLTLDRAVESQAAAVRPGVNAITATTGGGTSQPAGRPPQARNGRIAVGVGAALVTAALGTAGFVRWRTATTGAVPSAGAVGSASAAPSDTTAAARSGEPPPQPVAPPPTVAPAAGTIASTAALAPIAGSAPPPKVAAPARPVVVKPPTPTPRPATPSGDMYTR